MTEVDRLMVEEGVVWQRALIEAALDAVIVISEDGHILAFNRSAEEVFGYTQEAVIGKNMADLVVPVSLRKAHKDGLSRLKTTRVARILGQRLELTAMRSDGTEFPVELIVVQVPVSPSPVYVGYVRDISDRIRAEETLRASENRFRSLADDSPLMIWLTDSDGAATWFNRGWLAFTGCDMDQVVDHQWLKLIHPDDLEDYLRRFQDALVSRVPFSFEYRLRHRDGACRWLLGNGSPTYVGDGSFAGYACSCVDITERREAEEALRLTQFAVDRAGDAVFWVRPDSKLYYVNDRACNSLGFTRDELLGSSICDFTVAQQVEDWEAHWQRIKEQQSFTYETRHRRKDGSTFPVEITVNYIHFKSQEFNCALVRDITERHESQAILTRQAIKATLMHEATAIAAEPIAFEDALQRCVDLICKTIGWPLGHVYIPAQDGSDQLVPSDVWHADRQDEFADFVKQTRQTRFSRGNGLIGRVWDTGLPESVADVTFDHTFVRRDPHVDLQVRGALAFPVNVEKEIVAICAFFSKFPLETDHEMLGVMKTIGEQMGRVFERKRATERIARSEQELNDLFENAPVGLHVEDFDGTIRRANKYELTMLGYECDEYEGRNILEFHVDADRCGDYLRRLRSGETVENFSAQLRCKNGRIKHVVINSNVCWANGQFDHARCFTTDVTERYEWESALIASERQLRAISDAAIDAVILSDAENRVAHWNPAAERMFGYTAEEMAGQGIHEVLAPQRYHDKAHQAWNEFAATGKGRNIGAIRELMAVRKDGSEFPVELSVSGVELEGGWGAVAVVRDATDRKRVQQQLTAAMHDAQAANRAKSEFLALVSHEMRTPLNSILGMLDLSIDIARDEKLCEMLDISRRSGIQLKALINDMLDYSQIHAGRFSLRSEVIDVAQLLHRIQEIFCRRAQEKGLEFRWHVPLRFPTLVIGDDRRLYQIIENLLNNAIKFTETGFIAFRLEVIEFETKTVTLKVSVEDTGIGVKPEDRERIFQRFEQADSGSSRAFGGVGLGLSICAQLVELMHGRIRVEDGSLGGSRFCFTAVLEKASAEQVREFSAKSAVDQRCDDTLRGVHVLLAEDDPPSRMVAKRMLEGAGVVVTVAEDGRQVVEEFRRRPDEFAAIFMDMMMPHLDGIDATREIRQLQSHRIPIIAMTAQAMVGDQERILDAGLDAYVAKPVDMRVMLATLKDAIGIRLGAESTVMRQEEGQAEKDLKILDFAAFQRRCGDDIDVAKEIAILFGQTCEETIEVIGQGIAEEDFARVVRAAHKLKSSVGNMCATRALAAAQRVETAARDADLKETRDGFTELNREIRLLRQALADAMSI